MLFEPTGIAGAWLIGIEARNDERGFFARTVCGEEFAQHGLNAQFVQQSVAWNPTKATLRGIHYQADPYWEEKLVRVTRGAVFDVIVDMRRDSPTFGKWFAVELSAESRRGIYVPKGVAHGYQTVADNTEIYYQMTEHYRAEAARGIRWDDPDLNIPWPTAPTVMSERDRVLPALRDVGTPER